MHIKLIEKQDCYPLRSQVLRPGLPIESSHFTCDEARTTFHVGVLLDLKIRTVCTFCVESPPEGLRDLYQEFSQQELKAYRLRGMATDPDFRQKRLGASALEFAENELQTRQCNMLWFFAREVAFGFYEKLGFQFHGELFELPGVGPHKVMYKLYKTR